MTPRPGYSLTDSEVPGPHTAKQETSKLVVGQEMSEQQRSKQQRPKQQRSEPALPELGVAVVYFPALEPLLEAGNGLINALEIEPQTYWLKKTATEAKHPTAGKRSNHSRNNSRWPDREPNLSGKGGSYQLDERAFQRIQQWPQHKIIHSVGVPVGGSAAVSDDQVSALLQSVVRLRPHWVSEHLAFLQAEQNQTRYHTGFLLPPLQSREIIQQAVANIRRLQSLLPVPFAFENPVNYLQPLAGELPDGIFLGTIAEQADCGMVLDLHNLWCNQQNGRQSVQEVLSTLPLQRVWEIHLAGGDAYQNYWLDAHSGLVPEELMQICHDWLPSMPNLKAITFEIIPDYIAAKQLSTDLLLKQLQAIHTLWSSRHQRRSRRSQVEYPHTYLGENGTHLNTTKPTIKRNAQVIDTPPTMQEWENALGLLINRRTPATPLQAILATDPGINVLQQLVLQVRAGMLVDLLTLSYRLMVLHLGEQQVQQMMDTYWRQTLPEPFAAEEVQRFAQFIHQQHLPIPHLAEVMAYETRSLDVLVSGQAATVDFTCDPTVLLTALREGKLPEKLPEGQYELAVQP